MDVVDPQALNRLLEQARAWAHTPYDRYSGRQWFEHVKTRTQMITDAKLLGGEQVMRDVCDAYWRKPPSGHSACVELGGLDFARMDLRGVDLLSAGLRRACLRGADLRGALMRYVFLYRANLEGANLEGVDLRGCDCLPYVRKRRSAHPRGAANLRGANLREANLAYAKMPNVDLRGADLSGADLSAANLTGAQTAGALFFGAKVSPKTQLPTRMRKAARDLLVRLDTDPDLSTWR